MSSNMTICRKRRETRLPGPSPTRSRSPFGGRGYPHTPRTPIRVRRSTQTNVPVSRPHFLTSTVSVTRGRRTVSGVCVLFQCQDYRPRPEPWKGPLLSTLFPSNVRGPFPEVTSTKRSKYPVKVSPGTPVSSG